MFFRHPWLVLGYFSFLFLVACANSAIVSPTPTAPVLVTPTVPMTPTLALPSPAATLRPSVTPTFALKLPPTITEIAKGFGGPDDLALLSDGEILFSDVGNGTINRVALDGKVTTLVRGLVEPEGIVVLPDGSWIIAEQGKNRLVRFDPKSNQSPTTWLSLPNKTRNAGVDGIVRDVTSGDIIVPDSPNGTILRVTADGKSNRVIATGFARPTGADIERDGSIVVADEIGGAVKRIRPDGRVEMLGRFATPDDVAVDSAGNIFVASLGDNTVQRIETQTGAITLIAHVQQPQGIVIDAGGNLIVTEASLNRILRIKIH